MMICKYSADICCPAEWMKWYWLWWQNYCKNIPPPPTSHVDEYCWCRRNLLVHLYDHLSKQQTPSANCKKNNCFLNFSQLSALLLHCWVCLANSQRFKVYPYDWVLEVRSSLLNVWDLWSTYFSDDLVPISFKTLWLVKPLPLNGDRSRTIFAALLMLVSMQGAFTPNVCPLHHKIWSGGSTMKTMINTLIRALLVGEAGLVRGWGAVVTGVCCPRCVTRSIRHHGQF